MTGGDDVILSVIIVNYNVKYFLEQTLLSVRKAASQLPVEVFVVDNNSADGSVAMVQEKFPEVHLIANTDNPGFSIANNQAVRISNGKYVLLLNPDTVVEEKTFRVCLDFMESHPEAGGLGVKMIDGAGNFLPESKRGFPSPFVVLWLFAKRLASPGFSQKVLCSTGTTWAIWIRMKITKWTSCRELSC
jgi:GT2 family glycosyltransferase